MAADEISTLPPLVPVADKEPRKVVSSSDQIIAVPPSPVRDETLICVPSLMKVFAAFERAGVSGHLVTKLSI